MIDATVERDGFGRMVMDRNGIESRVRDIIVKQLNVSADQLRDSSSFLDDLGADSLDLVELVMAFETEFKNEISGEISEADAEKLRTVKDVVDYIMDKVS